MLSWNQARHCSEFGAPGLQSSKRLVPNVLSAEIIVTEGEEVESQVLRNGRAG